MSDDRISAKDFPAVQQAKEATKKALEYYRRMGSMDYQITEPERTAAELQRLRAENERLRQDAERYRWLTTRAGAFPALVRFIAANSGRVDTGFSTPGSVLQAQSISDAIDAARAHLEGRVSDE